MRPHFAFCCGRFLGHVCVSCCSLRFGPAAIVKGRQTANLGSKDSFLCQTRLGMNCRKWILNGIHTKPTIENLNFHSNFALSNRRFGINVCSIYSKPDVKAPSSEVRVDRGGNSHSGKQRPAFCLRTTPPASKIASPPPPTIDDNATGTHTSPAGDRILPLLSYSSRPLCVCVRPTHSPSSSHITGRLLCVCCHHPIRRHHA